MREKKGERKKNINNQSAGISLGFPRQSFPTVPETRTDSWPPQLRTMPWRIRANHTTQWETFASPNMVLWDQLIKGAIASEKFHSNGNNENKTYFS